MRFLEEQELWPLSAFLYMTANTYMFYFPTSYIIFFCKHIKISDLYNSKIFLTESHGFDSQLRPE